MTVRKNEINIQTNLEKPRMDAAKTRKYFETELVRSVEIRTLRNAQSRVLDNFDPLRFLCSNSRFVSEHSRVV